jgi:anion-transporting  ArsA/GET3 family ATPase
MIAASRLVLPHAAVTPAELLEPTLSRPDLILVTGKGGTGKSTLSAAIAALAARRRGRALAVDLSVAPRQASLAPSGAAVDVAAVNAETALPGALGRLLHIPGLAARLLGNRLLRLFIRTSPAVREMLVLDEIASLVEARSPLGCPVVVDLPASGHALSFLDTPRAVRRVLRVGPLAHIAARVEKLVLDPRRTALVVVALPEELPVNETIELCRRAAALGLDNRVVIVNQVPPPPFVDGDTELLAEIGGELAATARAAIAAAVEASAQVARLRAELPPAVPLLSLPTLVGGERERVNLLVEVLR